MPYNRKSFFDGFKADFDPTLNQSQVDGLEFLLGHFDTDKIWTDKRYVAYALATIYHETAGSMQPVEEGYYLGSDRKVKAFQKTLRYFPYFGRGYVQLTWRKNYDMAGKALGIDLVGDPDLAKEPQTAFQVLALGMFQGWFTGKKLADYINVDHTDYLNARKVINGTDRAALIAGYARTFEQLLKTSAAGPATNDQNNNSSSTNPIDNSANTDPLPTQYVQPVTVPLYVKVGAVFTFLTGVGINAGTIIEKKVQDLSPLEFLYCLIALGLCYFAVWWFRRERKAATQTTHMLIAAATEPTKHTVELIK